MVALSCFRVTQSDDAVSQVFRSKSACGREPSKLQIAAKGRSREMTNAREAELLAAAECGDVARLRELLPAAGDPTAFHRPDGVTPLMVAAGAGHQAVVELLIERGSNPSRRDAEGRSAAEYARRAGHTHLAARLDGIVDQDQTIW
ncbi:MAG: hypothetical protein JWO26_3716 [Rhodospirillales bacterium]|jgi:hypothetical protein|nr:hypothetical protein [Rhodospirillales bacterium]MDB5384084.1 hypothetical protein [Rhodospirillales bacterium]